MYMYIYAPSILRVGRSQNRGARVERGLDTRLGDGDGLLLHGLVDRDLKQMSRVRFMMMICLPPQGTPPHTQQPTWPTAHTAHSQHCGHTALPPGQKTNPRRRADPTHSRFQVRFAGTDLHCQ